MRVLHICSYYLSSNLFFKLFQNLDSIGVESTVFVPLSHNDREYWDRSEDKRQHVDIARFLSASDRFLYHQKAYKVFHYLETHYDLTQYDCIHAHSLFTNGLVAQLIYKKYKIPYIVALRNTDLNFFFKYFFIYRKDGIQIMRDAKRVIFLSESYKERTFKKYVPDMNRQEIASHCEVIPNGIDDFWLNNKQERINPIGTELKIINVGSIGKNKNQLLVAKAVRKLNENGTPASFTVVGDITDYNYCNKLKMVLPEIDILPFMRKECLIDCYRSHNFFVMTSYKETFGLVYAEAMSQGLPVIYSKGEGFDRQFPEGTVGYSVDPMSVEDLVTKIQMIINNYNRLAENCLKYCELFNWRKLAKKYKAIYEECLTIS